MSIMSFSQFVTTSIALIFAKSGTTCAKSHEEFVTKHGHRFELLFSDFFAFIKSQTMALDRKNKLRKKYYAQETLYDRMYDNFSVFVDFALKHIIVLDVETLYSGMSTQLNKFMKGYEYAFSENIDYLCENISYDFTYPRVSSFSEIVFHSDELDYFRKNYEEQYEFSYEYEPESIFLKNVDIDLKLLNSDNRSKKVQGHRQDYEQHLFNKGLNKKKRERGHFPHKSHKNKNDL
jgi:hypothetical protein